ncbi:MAG: hypothetical protein ACRYGR_07005, partial [Janthinobacterium lividum]
KPLQEHRLLKRQLELYHVHDFADGGPTMTDLVIRIFEYPRHALYVKKLEVFGTSSQQTS